MRARKMASHTLLPAARLRPFFPPFPTQLSPGKAAVPRRGPAIILREEAAEGQSPDGPMVRSSGLLLPGPGGTPPPCLPSSPGSTRPALGMDSAKVPRRMCRFLLGH